jgi:2-dehydro-3-deoxyphosphogluconate aldolase/(4S)-4-hydroxy-2-oxoglutarate aldolase
MKLTDPVAQRIAEAGVVAVLVIDREEDAVPLARALLEGGVDVMELTLRTPAALGALRAIRAEVPEMLAGIGTVLTTEQIGQVAGAGGAFAVSPGLNPEVVRAAADAGLPFAPGIMTPTDIDGAIGLGCEVLKFFPAGSSGGLPHLKNIAAPYAHLGLKYVPLGGVNAGNMGEYLGSDLIAAVGGSWLAPRDLINAGDWDEITRRAGEAMEIAREARA